MASMSAAEPDEARDRDARDPNVTTNDGQLFQANAFRTREALALVTDVGMPGLLADAPVETLLPGLGSFNVASGRCPSMVARSSRLESGS